MSRGPKEEGWRCPGSIDAGCLVTTGKEHERSVFCRSPYKFNANDARLKKCTEEQISAREGHKLCKGKNVKPIFPVFNLNSADFSSFQFNSGVPEAETIETKHMLVHLELTNHIISYHHSCALGQ
jgi:hypothetical protein